MVGYAANNTLTDHGTVTRGVCQEDENGNLTSIVEVQKIARKDGKVVYDNNGTWKEMDPNALVSMNFWGFTPKVLDVYKRQIVCWITWRWTLLLMWKFD